MRQKLQECVSNCSRIVYTREGGRVCMKVAGLSFFLQKGMWFATLDLGRLCAWTLEAAAMVDEPDVFAVEFEHKWTKTMKTVLGDLGCVDITGLERLVKTGKSLDYTGRLL